MNWSQKTQAFLSQPIDRVFAIKNCDIRSQDYAKEVDVQLNGEFLKINDLTFLFEIDSLEESIQEFRYIRHPLSDGKIEMAHYDSHAVFEEIKKFFSWLKTELSQKEDRYKFFYLWRKLREEIFITNSNKAWAKYLSILPADPRIVDTAIWDFLKISASISLQVDNKINPTLQNNSLFLFTIGPVQSFVSQARKTMDFYLGSFILSFLTFKAIEVIIQKFGPTNIIYPDLFGQPLLDIYLNKNFQFSFSNQFNEIRHLPTIPNRFVALLPTNHLEELSNLAQDMTEQINQVKEDALNLVFDNFSIKILDSEKNKITSQMQEFPECYWVALPFGVSERELGIKDLEEYFNPELMKKYEQLYNFVSPKFPDNTKLNCLYEVFYSTLEKFLGARKNFRKFSQLQVAERGRKCTICGERDVVFFREKRNKGKFTNFNKNLIDLTNNHRIGFKFLSEGEGLCSICFFKRTFGLYLENSILNSSVSISFPSTSEIAASHFKEYAIQQASDKFFGYVEKFKNILGDKFPETEPIAKLKPKLANKSNLEGFWFYEENLNQESFEENLGIKVSENELNVLRSHLSELTKAAQKKPSPYYAILYVDGDNMGKWLSGELLPEIKNSYADSYWEKLKQTKHLEGDALAEALMESLPLNKESKPRKLLTPAIHSSISTALANYTFEFVTQIVEKEHGGKLVYAGGDDVFAFVIVDELLEVMHKLRWAFSGQVRFEKGKCTVDLKSQSGFVEKDGRYILTMGKNASLSMGVVIAHYKNPMQLVIKKVFEMEKLAKAKGKNGFSICLMKRSHSRITTAKWLYETNPKEADPLDTIAKLKELQRVFSENNHLGFLSKSFLQKVSSEFSKLKDEQGNFLGNPNLFTQGIKRIISRSYQNIQNEGKKERLETIYKLLVEWFSMCQKNIDNFLNFCYLANFIENQEY